jgi:phage tail sheath gpL-like
MLSTVIFEHAETEPTMQEILIAQAGDRVQAGKLLMNYVRSLLGGARSGKVITSLNAVKATGTITLSSHVNTNTVTVNGIVFTCVSSGATGNQYNVGADDTETATNLAAALNANATLDGMVVATSALGVVTLTATVPGEIGNALTLAISANGSVSGARMTGGTNGAQQRTNYYGSAS